MPADAPASPSSSAAQRAAEFVARETAFRLGVLPTEQPHPRTRGLAEIAQADPGKAIRMILDVDRELLAAADRVFASPQYEHLVATLTRVLAADGTGRVFFTGCGATGRLSILLEACWRRACARADRADLADRAFSVMAGGDFALIRSVEGYEDFTDFGRRQLAQTGGGPRQGDAVIAITEGGETSFVIGTAWAGLDAGAEVFFVFNNPADVLRANVERSAKVIDEPRITKLDLAQSPMAVAGSTRMEATTIELLVVGSAIERAFLAATGEAVPPASHYRDRFAAVLDALSADAGVSAMSAMVAMEAQRYRQTGEPARVTYLADTLLLDVLTDTTERSPTFSLPAFRRTDQPHLPPSWSFVQDPTRDTPAAWAALLARPVRGIDWTADDYAAMNAPAAIVANPPALSRSVIERFPIGREPATDRLAGAAVVLVGPHDTADFRRAADAYAATFTARHTLRIGGTADGGDTIVVPMAIADGPMRLDTRLLAKLALNTLSTVTMAVVGRMVSNWMVHVSCTNKKLIDRGIRLITDQAHLAYDDAALRLFEAMEELASDPAKAAATSPVALVISRHGSRAEKSR